MQAIGTRHSSREVVQHQVAGHTLVERPGGLQALQHRLQLLAGGRPDEAVARVAQDDDQRPDRAPPLSLWIRDEPEPAEVELGHLARRALGQPHRDRASAPAAALDEAAQRVVRDRAAAFGQQLVDPSHLQPLGRQPGVDLLRPGRQLLLARGVRAARSGQAQRRQAGQLRLIRLGPVR